MPFSEPPLRASGIFSRRSRSVARRTFDDVRATGVRRSSPATWIGLAIRGRILHDTREERRMKIALAVLAAVLHTLALCDGYAHGDHKPKHGGIMGRGDDEVSVELVMERAPPSSTSRTRPGVPSRRKGEGNTEPRQPRAARPRRKADPRGRQQAHGKGPHAASGGQAESAHHPASGEEFWPIFSFR